MSTKQFKNAKVEGHLLDDQWKCTDNIIDIYNILPVDIYW